MQNLGDRGELVSVQQGYLFNYLMPKRLAQRATQEYLECALLSLCASAVASFAFARCGP